MKMSEENTVDFRDLPSTQLGELIQRSSAGIEEECSVLYLHECGDVQSDGILNIKISTPSPCANAE
jgi:hypothetical protein